MDAKILASVTRRRTGSLTEHTRLPNALTDSTKGQEKVPIDDNRQSPWRHNPNDRGVSALHTYDTLYHMQNSMNYETPGCQARTQSQAQLEDTVMPHEHRKRQRHHETRSCVDDSQAMAVNKTRTTLLLPEAPDRDEVLIQVRNGNDGRL
jgi:hypothetical protein